MKQKTAGMTAPLLKPDPRLDLVLERVIDVPSRTRLEGLDHARASAALVRAPSPGPITANARSTCGLAASSAPPCARPRDRSSPISAATWRSCRTSAWCSPTRLLPGYRPSPKPFFTAVLQLVPTGQGHAPHRHRPAWRPGGRRKHEHGLPRRLGHRGSTRWWLTSRRRCEASAALRVPPTRQRKSGPARPHFSFTRPSQEDHVKVGCIQSQRCHEVALTHLRRFSVDNSGDCIQPAP